MLSVTHGGRTEPVTRIIESSYERHREVNGPFTLSFTSIQAPDDGNPGHELLEEEALVTEDGHTYRIKQMQKSGRQKTVHAIHQYFDILNGIQKHDIFGGIKKLDEFLAWVFEGTGITFEVRGVTESQLMANFGKASGPKLIEQLLDAFECERDILPGPHLVFEKQIGPDNDEQFRWGHDVITHDYNVDTTELRTSITGFGGDGLVVTYTSPNAPLFPHAGEAEAVYDDRFLIADNFREYIKKQLVDEPEVSIDVESLKATERELGEKIWLILDPIGLKMRSRILAKTDRKPAYKSTAVVGNTLKRTRTDDLADTNIKIDDVNDRVDEVGETVDEHYRESHTNFEQTNEHIQATADALEKYTDERYGEVKREMSAQWEITAESIKQGVQESKGYTDSRELLIRDALAAAENKWDGDLSNIGTQITTVDGKVATVIDELGTLDTELGTLQGDVVSVREEFSSRIDETARKIELEVTGVIEYTDAKAAAAQQGAKDYTDGQVGTVRSEASANFTTLAGRINAKADSTTVSSLGTRVNSVEWDLNAVSGQISTKVSKTDYDGEKIVSMVNQTASRYKISAKNIELSGIAEVAGSLIIGNASNPGTKLEFYNSGLWRPYISAYGGSIASGLGFHAGDININAGDTLYLGGGSTTDVLPRGRWDFSNASSVTGLTAVAVLA